MFFISEWFCLVVCRRLLHLRIVRFSFASSAMNKIKLIEASGKPENLALDSSRFVATPFILGTKLCRYGSGFVSAAAVQVVSNVVSRRTSSRSALVVIFHLFRQHTSNDSGGFCISQLRARRDPAHRGTLRLLQKSKLRHPLLDLRAFSASRRTFPSSRKPSCHGRPMEKSAPDLLGDAGRAGT